MSYNLYGWGRNYYGQLGLGHTNDISIPTKINHPNNIEWKNVKIGSNHTFIIDILNNVYCCGYNYHGMLGNGESGNDAQKNEFILFQHPEGKLWKDINGGYYHTLAIDEDNDLYSVGYNHYNQINRNTNTLVLKKINHPNANCWWKKVYCCNYASLAIDNLNQLYGWGRNEHGQLIGVITEDEFPPTLINHPENDIWIKIESLNCNLQRIFGIDSSGRLYAWGYNGDYGGVLGIGLSGRSNSKTIPTQVLHPENDIWVKIASGGENVSAAIDSSGRLYAWGRNDSGQLGDGTTQHKNSPTKINHPQNIKWKDVQCGQNLFICLDENDQLYSWGWNKYGQLGNGIMENSIFITPVLINNPENGSWISIKSSNEHVFAFSRTKPIIKAMNYNIIDV